MKTISRELIGAFAVPIILSILKHGDTYGYEIMQEVKRLTNNKIKWREASIYPVLKMMVATGLVKFYWDVQSNGRPRKYYTILEDGLKLLEEARVELDIVYSLFCRLYNPKT